ncbi:MAG TPA: MFS transporter, partial [Pseudonocardiaceae bacterium]|nr:MFS transporter [Pseudonocardiaceae bacterium]
MYGIGQGAQWGWSDPRVLGLIIGGLLLLALFVRVERTAAQPLLNMRTLSRRAVATVLGATSLVQGTAFAASAVMTAVIPLYPHIPGISDGLGWTAVHSAVVGLPAGAVLFVMGILGALATRRFGLRAVWLVALPIMIAGLVLEAFFHHDATQLIVTGVIAALGTGVVYGCTPILVMSAVSADEQAQASGMSLMLVGLTTSLSGQILYTVLAGRSTVFHGTALYHDAAYRNGYFVLAGLVLIGLVASVLIPRLHRPGADHPAEEPAGANAA